MAMPPRYGISKFAFVSWSDGNLHISSPVTGKTFTTGDASLLHVLSSFATPHMLGILELAQNRTLREIRAAQRRPMNAQSRLEVLGELLQRAYLWP